jgi:hypothetical protein
LVSWAAVAGPSSPEKPEVVPATVKMLLVAAGAGAPTDLPLAQLLHQCHPPDLRPLLHVQHLSSS